MNYPNSVEQPESQTKRAVANFSLRTFFNIRII